MRAQNCGIICGMACVKVQLGIVGWVIVLCGCARTGISGPIRDAAVGGGESQSTGGTSQGTGGAVPSGNGGFASGGTTSTNGGAGGSSTTAGVTGPGGGLAEFCAGSTKVAYQGQVLTPAVTSYDPLGILNCCASYGVRLHTSKDIGQDLQVIVDVAVGPDVSGTYEIGTSQWAVRAGLRIPSEDLYTRHSVVGSIEIKGSYTDPAPWQMGLCLEVTDTATDLYGTRVYVPSVNVLGFTLPSPLDFFLLQDSTLTVDKAELVPLETLPLAPTAFLRLDQIDFVEKASHWIGVVPEYAIIESLQKTLGHVPLYGTPFVIKVEGQALFLGAFMSFISSVGYRVPTVWVDEMVTDGFPLRAGPLTGGTDALDDARVVKVLTDAGRWVP